MIKIEFASNISDELKKQIDDEFEIQTNKNDVICNYIPFNFLAKEENSILGVLTGYVYYGEVYIHELIVLEQYRRKGIGRQLIKEV